MEALDVCERWPRLFDAGVAQAMGPADESAVRTGDEELDEIARPTRRRPGEGARDYADRLRAARERNAERIRNRRHGRRIGGERG